MPAAQKKSYNKPRQCIKKQRHYFADKGLYGHSYGFSSSHVQMWELDHKEGWAPKNWCFRTVVLEKTLKSPLDSREIKPVNPKGNQPWIFTGRTDAEAEAPVLWPPDVKSQLIRKGPDAGKDWRREERGTTEDEMVGWHHQLNGHEFEWTVGDGEGQGSLVCCSPWGRKKWDTTEWLKNHYLDITGLFFKRVDRIEFNKEPELVPSMSGGNQIAACPLSPTADDPLALPSPTSSLSSSQ